MLKLLESGLRCWGHRVACSARHWLHKVPGLARIPGAPVLCWSRIESLPAYLDHVARHGADSWTLESALATANPDVPFKVPGYCWIDQRPVEFGMDYLFADDLGTRRIPNWRERMICPYCALNNRQRCALHLATEVLRLRPASRIYITEQVTPSYRALRDRHPTLIGSEFLGDEVPPGFVNLQGVRHEDLTNLSLADASVDAILSFDVLEHIPNVKAAFAECARVLSPAGAMIFSIPFMEHAQASRTRASFDSRGVLVHSHPPIYHGDPVKPEEGVLCFNDFGWDVLDTAREAGFAEATAIACRSVEYGYLGGVPLLFAAWNGKSKWV